jgi:hypothetical protein
MKAFRVRRNTKGAYLAQSMIAGSKLCKELSEKFQRHYDDKKQEYSDFEMFCNADSLDALLKYIYNDLGSCVFGNGRHYKTISGAAKYIQSLN